MSNIPNIDLGSLSLETALCEEAIDMGDTSVNTLGRQLPTNETDLSEMLELKRELADMRKKKEQAEEMTDIMTRDLCDFQEEMARKDDSIRDMADEVIILMEKMTNLEIELQNERRQTTVPTILETTVAGNVTTNSQNDDGLPRLHNPRTDAHIQVFQEGSSDTKPFLQSQEALLQQISFLEEEVKNQQKRSGWLKSTCERLTTKIREKDAALKALEQSAYAMKESSHNDGKIFYGQGATF
ncbi:hypothetical protein HYFRA_00001706 [Hymenoscyphus fraxineus]|uniref:Uncharacterized protein n=1 Tax=Hymenoscyphus fraxineus TaxID=746836 RepID=A0A9N9PYB7_9HELO|nr:hypothetical protein HYFRA_00001706 [Hymenoscyphus fraxineus]